MVAVWEQLWPSHMVAHYAETYADRWPAIPSISVFASTWLPALIGVGLAIATLLTRSRHWKTRSPEASAAAGLVFLPIYYLLGSFLLFRNGYALMGHLWLAWPGLALLMTRQGRITRLLGLAALVPACWSVMAGVVQSVTDERTWQAQPVALPNGQKLWFHGHEAGNFAALARELDRVPEPRSLSVFLASGGIHHFFRTQRIGRHWWFLPEFVRPWEKTEVMRALLQHDEFFVANLGQAAGTGSPPGVATLWLPLSPLRNQQIFAACQESAYGRGIGHLGRRPALGRS